MPALPIAAVAAPQPNPAAAAALAAAGVPPAAAACAALASSSFALPGTLPVAASPRRCRCRCPSSRRRRAGLRRSCCIFTLRYYSAVKGHVLVELEVADGARLVLELEERLLARTQRPG